MEKYYTLVVRHPWGDNDDGLMSWGPEFGDWDLSEVKSQLQSFIDDGIHRTDLKIICTDGNQKSIDQEVEKMKADEWNDYVARMMSDNGWDKPVTSCIEVKESLLEELIALLRRSHDSMRLIMECEALDMGEESQLRDVYEKLENLYIIGELANQADESLIECRDKIKDVIRHKHGHPDDEV